MRCAADEPVSLHGGTGGVPLTIGPTTGGCAGHALFMPSLQAAPILTLNGQASADSGGDETDEEADADHAAAAAAAAADLGEGDADPPTITTPATGAGTATATQDEDEEEGTRALNTERAEYTMTEETAQAAVRQDADTLLGTTNVRNVDAAEESPMTPTESPMTLVAAIETAGSVTPARTAQAVIVARKPLSPAQRKALLHALSPGGKYKGVSKLTNAKLFTDAILQLRSPVEMDISVQAWVLWARARLAGDGA
jgi:hypothetical protein